MTLVLRRRSYFGWPQSVNAGSAPCRNGMVAHYDGGNQNLAGRGHSACIAYWKNTRRFHMNTRGWNDIGYSFGVCPHGEAFEGRGFGKQQAAQPGGNSTWTSCTFMTGPKENPTQKQLQAWWELRAYLRKKGVAPAVQGHQYFTSTSCPGSRIMTLVRNGTLKKSVSGTTPKPPTVPLGGPKWSGRYITQPPIMRGNDVKTWQSKMKRRGWAITADGAYGSKSEAVCRKFQAEKGLKVDGVVGPNTWAKTWSSPVT
jgi:Putative peptidoglycan binding domain/N-acetylmuramoyl-L-alanine amidase